ncbi:pyrophosphatase PpaX [Microbacterium faecale]|uniref:Pyrophosphatase PpaX n=1 Tax=Microbacterium faecale TaxID=1804630 RepID=A0A916Y543_9MICO|nr:HAD family hydrolase [Microbacterium faecale]GGD31570.1 pyrophosphatase PpaX [Microbacterium faecale]
MSAYNAVLAVIFDLEGTLLNSAEMIRSALDDACRGTGESRPWSFLDLRDPITTVRRARGDIDVLLHSIRNADLEPLPGVVDALQSLQVDCTLAVATNARREVTEALLERSGLAPYFTAIVSVDDVRLAKSDPEAIHRACSWLGVAASQAIVVGDSLADLVAARAAGARGVHAAWTGAASLGTELVASHPQDLRDFVSPSGMRDDGRPAVRISAARSG